jgi:hypothetical protein
MSKLKKDIPGVPLGRVRVELGVAHNTVIGLINRGELKLNDYDRVDEDHYEKYKTEWLKKPEWMRKGLI